MRADLEQQLLAASRGSLATLVPAISSAKHNVTTVQVTKNIIYFFSEAAEFPLNIRYLLQTHPDE